MEENKIPTVSEFTKSKDPGFLYGVNGYGICQKFEDLMIEFAKMHVKKALEEAAKKAEIDSVDSFTQGITFYVSERSIVNSYPLENIK